VYQVAAGLSFENDGKRMHQEAVDPLFELIADQKGDHDRADRPHQPVAQLDQMIEERHPALFELGLPVVFHHRFPTPPRLVIPAKARI
jgi:hypothetical protein